jgi:polyisoprenoid-binding protein YceI
MQKFVLILLLFLGLAARAAPVRYVVDPSHTGVEYEIGHMGLSLQHGQFTRVSGAIVMDESGRNGSIDVSVDVDSLTTPIPLLTSRLKGEQFFNAPRFPLMQYRARQLVYDGEVLADVVGELTLLGVTRPVTLHVRHFGHAKNPITGIDSYGVNAETVIRRSDFGMTAYLPVVADEVKLFLTLEAYQEQLSP